MTTQVQSPTLIGQRTKEMGMQNARYVNDPNRMLPNAAPLAVISVLILLVVGVGAFTNWFGLAAPRFTTGVNYKFEYTIKTTHPVGKETILGRGFVVDDETVFSTPVAGTRGESFLAQDFNLPPNTFRLVERQSPAIVVGGRTFQKETPYTEVRYNQATTEPQTVIPNLKPRQ